MKAQNIALFPGLIEHRTFFVFSENSSITAFIINSQLFNFTESRIYAQRKKNLKSTRMNE